MKARCINPYTDYGFKKLFGEEANKDLLIDFLNQLLPERHQIKELRFRNPEKIGDVDMDHKADWKGERPERRLGKRKDGRT